MPGIGANPHTYISYHGVGEGATSAAALTAAKANAEDIFRNLGVFNTDYATTKTALTALTDPWVINDTLPIVPNTGNLYGSSRDVGAILNKLPLLSETGGRVNRVGFHRVIIEGTFEKFGFFVEETAESLKFDTDSELAMHKNREMLRGANELTEAMLQMDIINSAGVVVFCGTATSTNQISGEAGSESLPTFDTFVRLGITLMDNRMPTDTKILSGSRLIDTKTIDAAYPLLVGSEMIPHLRKMTDSFGEPAFVDLRHYKSQGNTMKGEIGSIDKFRIIVVQEQLHWAGAGATVTAANAGYRHERGKYNVYPMVVIGKKSFTTIGFQASGTRTKFEINILKPESKRAYTQLNPFGETGFTSIKFYYGFMLLRAEWIAVIKSVAPY